MRKITSLHYLFGLLYIATVDFQEYYLVNVRFWFILLLNEIAIP